jgi:DNA-binding transcriptional LysR family regulator
MNDQQMRSFISVAKHKSISKAAEELNISQQGLSRVIGVIEDELGVKLFTRTAGGMELTALGSMILPAVKSMAKGYEDYMKMINDIIAKHEKTITITCEHAFPFKALHFDEASRLENINFKILIAGNADTCVKQVLHETADIGFCHNNSTAPRISLPRLAPRQSFAAYRLSLLRRLRPRKYKGHWEPACR